MARKQRIKDDTPEGGWLCPPPTEGLKPLAIAVPGRNGKRKWKPVKQTAKDRKLRKKWEKRMAKADAKGIGRFKWPPKD